MFLSHISVIPPLSSPLCKINTNNKKYFLKSGLLRIEEERETSLALENQQFLFEEYKAQEGSDLLLSTIGG